MKYAQAFAALVYLLLSSAHAATNRVMRLDGAGDYIEVASNAALMPSAEITIEMWMNPEARQGGDPRGVLLKKGDGVDCCSSQSYEILHNGQYAVIAFFVGTTSWVEGWAPAPVGQWTHIAATYSQADSLFSVFTNGVLHVSTNADAGGNDIAQRPLRASTPSLRIGANLPSGQGLDGLGMVDDVRIWNQARTGEEIRRDLNRKFSGKEVSLVAWWNFDQGNGVDATGNGFNGVPGGNVAFDSDPHTPTAEFHHALVINGGAVYPTTPGQLERANSLPAALWSPESAPVIGSAPVFVSTRGVDQGVLRMSRQSNRALRLDGVDDLMTVTSAADLMPTDEITFECWMYPEFEPTRPQTGWVAKGDGTDAYSNRSYEIRYTPNGVNAQLFLGNSAGTKTYVELFAPAVTAKWVHVAATYTRSESTFRLFTNGVLAAQANMDPVGIHLSNRPIRTSTVPLLIGQIGSFTISRAKGMIDDVRIWKEAKTAAEIRRDMARPLTGKEAGLVAWWNFNAGTGADGTGNGHIGTFSGGPVLASEVVQPVITATRAVEATFPVDLPTTFYRLQGSVASDLGPWLNIGDAFSGPMGTARAFAPNPDGPYRHFRVVRD